MIQWRFIKVDVMYIIHFTTKNRFDSLLMALIVEGDKSAYCTMISQCQGFIMKLLGTTDKLLYC